MRSGLGMLRKIFLITLIVMFGMCSAFISSNEIRVKVRCRCEGISAGYSPSISPQLPFDWGSAWVLQPLLRGGNRTNPDWEDARCCPKRDHSERDATPLESRGWLQREGSWRGDCREGTALDIRYRRSHSSERCPKWGRESFGTNESRLWIMETQKTSLESKTIRGC